VIDVDFNDTSWRGLARRVAFVARVWYRHAPRKWWRRHVTTRRLSRHGYSMPLGRLRVGGNLSARQDAYIRQLLDDVDPCIAVISGVEHVPIGAPIPVSSPSALDFHEKWERERQYDRAVEKESRLLSQLADDDRVRQITDNYDFYAAPLPEPPDADD
jgi:hypothetical protein